MTQTEFIATAIIDFLLFLFGLGYNGLISWAEEKAWEDAKEGKKKNKLWQFFDATTALQVAFGTAITLVGFYAIDYFVNVEGRAIWFALSAFVGSGLPMIAGSAKRYSRHLNEFLTRRIPES